MDSLSVILGAVVGALSIFSFCASALIWYRASIRKGYAAERDFNHLKNSHAQLSQNIEQLWKLMDEKFDRNLQLLESLHNSIAIKQHRD